jgi:uncharacterized membrane protein (DUF2068 family)
MHSRPMPVIVAAILMALISLVGLPGPLLPGSEEVPAVVIYGGIVLGILGLIGAVGLWMLKKWGFWLTIVVNVLNLLSSAPGVAFAPNGVLRVFATVGVVVPALIIVLVVLPRSRHALTTS